MARGEHDATYGPSTGARGRAAPLRQRFRRPAVRALERYVTSMPAAQNAIDAVPGWVGSMPPHTALVAGEAPLHADTRIAWLLRDCFDVVGRAVLELGPLEGSHTFMLHEAGAGSIEAIEANAPAFMRCLVTKEVLGLARARFLLGDFTPWLEAAERRYDLVLASGVLYHSADPVRLLELIGRQSDAMFLWTHYFDEEAMGKGDPRRRPFSGRVALAERGPLTLRLHERTYRKAWRDARFCGGTQDRHYWLERDGILALLAALGFARIAVADDLPDHPYGPSLSIFAARPGAAGVRDGVGEAER